jgi:hypothetical protein
MTSTRAGMDDRNASIVHVDVAAHSGSRKKRAVPSAAESVSMSIRTVAPSRGTFPTSSKTADFSAPKSRAVRMVLSTIINTSRGAKNPVAHDVTSGDVVAVVVGVVEGVGASVGVAVVGTRVGKAVGLLVGARVGARVGTLVGAAVGEKVAHTKAPP